MSNQAACDRFTTMAEPESPGAARSHDHRLERLIDRLPGRWRAAVKWLRDPSVRWVRIPASLLLIVGGFLFILPILGLWMVPLGLVRLAEDVPVLRRLRERTLDWIARHRPHWFAEGHTLKAPNASSISRKEGTS